MSQQLQERRGSATPERWEALSEFEQMRERMRRMLEQTFGGLGLPSDVVQAGSWSPLVDIEETDDAYVVEAELPGVDRKDVDVEAVGNELAITGEIKEREKKGVLRRSTRRTGRFDYRVRLPEPIDTGKVEAKLSDGVLTVRVPKLQRAERHRIEISS